MADRLAPRPGQHRGAAGRDAGGAAGVGRGAGRHACTAVIRLADRRRAGWRGRPVTRIRRAYGGARPAGAGRRVDDLGDRAGACRLADGAGVGPLCERVARGRPPRRPNRTSGEAPPAAGTTTGPTAPAALAALPPQRSHRQARPGGGNAAGAGDGRSTAPGGVAHHAACRRAAPATAGETAAPGGRLALSAAVAAKPSTCACHQRAERGGAAGERSAARVGACRLWCAGQHRGDPARSGGDALRAGAGAGHPQRAGHRAGGRRGAQPVCDRGAHRHRFGPQRDRHRGSQCKAGDCVPVGDPVFGGTAEARRPADAGTRQGDQRRADLR